ncbi:hypothetical protein [Halalkalibacterium ligniniphilum]|uniref:hypothetical protein n=1 Tax=Halalkalibacterium ligniniphilum TaxID=1134413 RepID=UPI000363608C|nr:hypothetical protein [Halalkalibacterium ligniniphilum]
MNRKSYLYAARMTDMLANVIPSTSWEKVEEVIATTIQHEGIHQGQWYVAFKQAEKPIPKEWV